MPCLLLFEVTTPEASTYRARHTRLNCACHFQGPKEKQNVFIDIYPMNVATNTKLWRSVVHTEHFNDFYLQFLCLCLDAETIRASSTMHVLLYTLLSLPAFTPAIFL